jgi:hypothetical protein
VAESAVEANRTIPCGTVEEGEAPRINRLGPGSGSPSPFGMDRNIPLAIACPRWLCYPKTGRPSWLIKNLKSVPIQVATARCKREPSTAAIIAKVSAADHPSPASAGMGRVKPSKRRERLHRSKSGPNNPSSARVHPRVWVNTPTRAASFAPVNSCC